MSLTYRYRLYPGPQPVVSLGGRFSRPRPVIPVAVSGPLGTHNERALLDTGADDTIFPDAVAGRIGLDLTGAPPGSARGAGGNRVLLRYAAVTLRLTQGNEQAEWQAWVGFTPTPLNRGLLGFAGFLQFFTATFRGDREEVELEANALLPGP
jgi:hypothetical protein